MWAKNGLFGAIADADGDKQLTRYMNLFRPDKHSEFNNLYNADSLMQDLIAVMDACLHNSYDAHRDF
jgi:hypothetical protein